MIPSSAMDSTSGLERSMFRVFDENFPGNRTTRSATRSHEWSGKQRSRTSESIEYGRVPLSVSDTVCADVLRKPVEMGSLGDVGFELHDVGALLDLSAELLDTDEGDSWGPEDRGGQQGDGCSEDGRESHIE